MNDYEQTARVLALLVCGCCGAFGIYVDENIVVAAIGLGIIIFSIAYGCYKEWNVSDMAKNFGLLKRLYREHNPEVVDGIDRLLAAVTECDRAEDEDRSDHEVQD